MSVQLVSMALRQRLPAHLDKLILVVFAEHAGADGLSFPSVDLVAAEVQCSPRTVQRVIRRFEDLGLLQMYRKANGRGYPTCYRVVPDAIGAVPEYAELRQAQRGEAAPPPAPDPDKRQGELLPVPSFVVPVDNSGKGDSTVSPFPPGLDPQKGDKSAQKGDKSSEKGDSLVSPEPLTINLDGLDRGPDPLPITHKESANADPNLILGRTKGAAMDGGSGPRSSPSPRTRLNTRKPRGASKAKQDTFRESLAEIEEKARRHSIEPRKRFEHDFAFRNRVNASVGILACCTNDCRRLNLPTRRPDETVHDFETRVTKADLQQRGLASSLSPEQARRQALGKR